MMDKAIRNKQKMNGSIERSQSSGLHWLIALIVLMSLLSLALILLDPDLVGRANGNDYQTLERITDTPVPEATPVPYSEPSP